MPIGYAPTGLLSLGQESLPTATPPPRLIVARPSRRTIVAQTQETQIETVTDVQDEGVDTTEGT